MNILFVCALLEESLQQTSLYDFPILHTGVGKINAGYKTALAIAEHRPDLVINFGSCGSFNYEKGTLLKVKEVVNGDMDAEPIVPYSVTPFDEKGSNFKIGNEGVSCFTSETFITKNKVKNFSPNKLDLFKKCGIFEMELYSIVKVCREFGTPVISYKWVSDDGGIEDWKTNCVIGYKKFSLIIYNDILNGENFI